MTLGVKLLIAATLIATTAISFSAEGWTFSDGDGAREVKFAGKPVLRHMNAWDPARRDETYKPFTHVFDFAGEKPITKGPGGQFTHHRGCFIGWNKVDFGGKSYDFWHCKTVERRHVKYLDESKAGADSAVLVSVTNWPTPEGAVVVEETQRLTARKQSAGLLVLDFDFTLKAPSGPVKLNGDVQHAGFHFRASEEVQATKGETKYTLPEGAKLAQKNGKPIADNYEGANWVVCSFVTGGRRYHVAHFNHPANPAPLQYSTRNYGRFGAFSPATVEAEKPLNLRYRLTISEKEQSAADWQKEWDKFAGK